MIEYGALFNGSFAEQLGESFDSLVRLLSEISPLWYVGGIILFVLFVRMLTKNSVSRK